MDEGVLVAAWVLGPGIGLGPKHLYWTEAAGTGAVQRIPLGGGKPTTLWKGKQAAWDIIWHQGHVYFSRAIFGSALGEVLKVPDTGGDATTIANGLNGPTALAVDRDGVYYATRQDIHFALHDGSPATELIRGGKNITEITAADGYLYWVDAGELQRMTRDTKQPQRIALLGSDSVSNLLIDDAHVYLFDPKASAIMRVAKDGSSSPQRFVDTAGTGVDQLAQDHTTIFWTTRRMRQPTSCCHVMRADKSDGKAHIVTEAELPSALAVNGSHVFYLTHGSNVAIHKKRKNQL